MRVLFATMSLCWVLPQAALAQPQDFTGFYAGVNAGYAFGRDGDAGAPDLSALSPKADADARGLPPSARQASETMAGGKAKPGATPFHSR